MKQNSYRRCLNLDSKNDKCLYYLAQIAEKENNIEQAKKMYFECLEMNDKLACVHYALAQLLMKQTSNNNDNELENNEILYLWQVQLN